MSKVSTNQVDKVDEYLKARVDDRMLDIADRISSVKECINSISNGERVAIWGMGEHTDYLFKSTDVASKNIVLYIDKKILEYNNQKVVRPENVDYSQIDCVIVSSFKHRRAITEELEKVYSFNGRIINLYDDDANIPFYVYLKNRKACTLMDKNMLDEQIESFCRSVNEQTDYYMNYALYNKYADGYMTEEFVSNYFDELYNDVAIVIQGPIKYEEDFTYQTILQYKKMFPGITIIVSTWKNEKDNSNFKKFEDVSNCYIILNDMPLNSGIMNVNYQIKSTYGGLLKARELGTIEYVLKIRSDCRLYAADSIAMMKLFANKKIGNGLNAKGRIVCSPIDKKAIYYHCDYYNFGFLEDMLKFWKDEEINQYIYRGEDGSNPGNAEMQLYCRYVSEFKFGEHAIDNLYKLYAFIPLNLLEIVWLKYYSRVIGSLKTLSLLENIEYKMENLTMTEWLYSLKE